MREHPNRSRLTVVVLVIVLCAFDIWAGWQWSAGRREVSAAGERLAKSKELARRIKTLSATPIQIEEGARSSAALAKLVESAAGEAGLSPDRIAHIAPGDPRRLADSPYQQQQTDIELREVTLRQLIAFSLAVVRNAPGVKVSTLTMRVPPGDDKPLNKREIWNIQLVLTSHIYAPKIRGPQ